MGLQGTVRVEKLKMVGGFLRAVARSLRSRSKPVLMCSPASLPQAFFMVCELGLHLAVAKLTCHHRVSSVVLVNPPAAQVYQRSLNTLLSSQISVFGQFSGNGKTSAEV